MKTGVYLREYKGMYTVEYSTPSVGMTLFVTWDKAQAKTELEKWQGMTPDQLEKAVLSKC